VPTITNLLNGNSGGFGPCATPGLFLNNFICVSCNSVNNYIDGANAINCLPSCNVFIYSSTGLQICSDYVSCTTNYLSLSTNTLSCGACNNKILGSFCVSSCSGYFVQPTGCSSTFAASGLCNMPIEENSICIVPVKYNL